MTDIRSSGLVAAAIQFEPQRGQLERNRNKLLLLLSAALQAQPELVVLPEMCTSGYIFHDPESIMPFCEQRGGHSERLFSSEAVRSGATICYGWPEHDPESGGLFNSASVCFPDGQVLHYRKKLLYDADRPWAEPGDTPYPVWTSRHGLRCSLGICMDLNDDDFIRFLVDQKIRVLAFPTNWLDQGFKVWNYWAYRLDGTETCLVAGNRYGVEDGTPFCGDSAVLDGRVLLGCTEANEDTVVLAHIPERPTPYED